MTKPNQPGSGVKNRQNSGNRWRGYINGEWVPRVVLKDGDIVGISINGRDNSAEITEGQFVGQIAFKESGLDRLNALKLDKVSGVAPGQFVMWDGEDWVNVDAKEAYEKWTNQEELREIARQEDLSSGRYDEIVPATRPLGVFGPTGEQTSLRFPSDVSTESFSDYVIFDFYDYVPPFRENQAFESELPDALKASKVAEWWNGKSNRRLYVNETLAQYNRTGVAAQSYQSDGSFPQVLLYMPDDISDTYAANWEGKAFGATTAGILSGTSADTFANKIKSLTNTTGKAISKAPVEMAAGLVTNLAKGITGDSINTGDIFGGVSGVIRNPNTEVLFQKMNLRTFDLTFKLSPYKMDEAITIEKIIKAFKKAMLPQYQLGNHKVLGYNNDGENKAVEASFIKVPKVCKVSYMRGSGLHPHLPKYKMCAITDVKINYTPDGNYAVFNDGRPVATELKISFMETKLIFSEDVDQGGY
jgi:hypothetical protein